MDKMEFPAHKLPDIEIYGGDTVPWEVTLIRDDGTSCPSSAAENFSCTLTFSPFKVTTGLGGKAISAAPLLTKKGTIKETSDGGAAAVFDFATQDTIDLRGKFLYQIEISNGDDLRIAQGHIYIRQNINR